MRDLRRYAQQTTIRLIFGGLFLLFVIGLGLVYLIYGPNAVITGLLCMALGLAPVGLIILILWIMERIVKNANRD